MWFSLDLFWRNKGVFMVVTRRGFEEGIFMLRKGKTPRISKVFWLWVFLASGSPCWPMWCMWLWWRCQFLYGAYPGSVQPPDMGHAIKFASWHVKLGPHNAYYDNSAKAPSIHFLSIHLFTSWQLHATESVHRRRLFWLPCSWVGGSYGWWLILWGDWAWVVGMEMESLISFQSVASLAPWSMWIVFKSMVKVERAA